MPEKSQNKWDFYSANWLINLLLYADWKIGVNFGGWLGGVEGVYRHSGRPRIGLGSFNASRCRIYQFSNIVLWTHLFTDGGESVPWNHSPTVLEVCTRVVHITLFFKSNKFIHQILLFNLVGDKNPIFILKINSYVFLLSPSSNPLLLPISP